MVPRGLCQCESHGYSIRPVRAGILLRRRQSQDLIGKQPYEGFPKSILSAPDRRDQYPKGRIYPLGEATEGVNKSSKRELTQASRRCRSAMNPSSLHRMPTPLKRC